MSLFVVTLIAWICILLFAIMPKSLSLVEQLFLYFFTVIMMTSIFTMSDVNLHTVTISRSPEKSFGANISRMIPIPLLVLMSLNAVRSKWRGALKRTMFCTAWVALTLYEWLLERLGIITYHKWNVLYAMGMYLLYLTVASGVAWWFVKLRREEETSCENL